MHILLIEPYFTGSHATWAEGYARHSRHQVEILSLPGRFWKWRMHGGAVTLARQFLESNMRPDLLLATDMLDLTTFLSLTRRRTAGIPAAMYFHENQLTYPWSPDDRDLKLQRDKHYGFINFTSALAADRVFFNSAYHRNSFLAALPQLLKHFPDYNELPAVAQLEAQSQVLHLGLDLERFDAFAAMARRGQPLVLWGHRWEYDKGPEEFFRALEVLSARGVDFELAVLGENFSRRPKVFLAAQQNLAQHIVQFGYAESFAEYARWLWQADVLPVTSQQDFFGASVIEAVYCRTWPMLPRRLAYPTLISPEQHPDCFYDGFDDLVSRLEAALGNVTQTRRFSLQAEVARFDWRQQAPQYDAAFAALVA